jgi:hypothetical protein
MYFKYNFLIILFKNKSKIFITVKEFVDAINKEKAININLAKRLTALENQSNDLVKFQNDNYYNFLKKNEKK